jgi:hypothetical protein
MFNGNFKESDGTVIIPDVNPDIFHQFLRYLYCQKVAISKTTLLDLYTLADKYLDRRLKKVCLSAITETNVAHVMQQNTNANQFEEVHERCKEVVYRNPFFVYESEDFTRLNFDNMKELVTHCQMRCTPLESAETVRYWMAYNERPCDDQFLKDFRKQVFNNSVKRLTITGQNKTSDFGFSSSLSTISVIAPISLVGFGIIWNPSLTMMTIRIHNSKRSYVRRINVPLGITEGSYVEEIFVIKMQLEPNDLIEVSMSMSENQPFPYLSYAKSSDDRFTFTGNYFNLISYLIVDNDE